MGTQVVPDTSFRRRSIVFNERDELAYSRVLREFDPGVEFFARTEERYDAPTIEVPNIPNAISRDVAIVLPTPFEEDWGLEFERSRREWHDPTKRWAFDSPLLGYGEIVVVFPMGNEPLVKFCMRVVRLRSKVTWKRTGFGLDACRWSQSGERRGLGNGVLIDPNEKIELNKYYDDSLWDDRLPEQPTLPEVYDRMLRPVTESE